MIFKNLGRGIFKNAPSQIESRVSPFGVCILKDYRSNLTKYKSYDTFAVIKLLIEKYGKIENGELIERTKLTN